MLLLLLVDVAGLLAGIVVVVAAVTELLLLLLRRRLLRLLLLLRLDDDQVASLVVAGCCRCRISGCGGHRRLLGVTGTGDHGRHDVGWRQDNRYMVVFTLLATALAVGVIAAHSNTLINHLDLVIYRGFEKRERKQEITIRELVNGWANCGLLSWLAVENSESFSKTISQVSVA